MTRTSDNYYVDGVLQDGYDYDNQAWVRHGVYVRCGHPEAMNCCCYGKLHAGEKTKAIRGMENTIPFSESEPRKNEVE